MDNKNSSNLNENKNTSNDIKINLAYIYDMNVKITEKMTLNELIVEINKNYFLSEDEYEILIGENVISNVSNNTLVLKLLEKYKSNNIKIKTFKNIFDLQNQLNSYDNFLSKNISLKTDDIKLLKEEYSNILNDLNNI